MVSVPQYKDRPTRDTKLTKMLVKAGPENLHPVRGFSVADRQFVKLKMTTVCKAALSRGSTSGLCRCLGTFYSN